MLREDIQGDTSILGLVNYITFLVSATVLGVGFWLASRAKLTDCIAMLHGPVVVLGALLMVISLMGFAGTSFRQSWLVRLYLVATFLIILGLFGLIFASTDRGAGQAITKGRFLEYRLDDYKGLLHDRVADPKYWDTVRTCLRDGDACADMKELERDPNTGKFVEETPDTFYTRKLSPIQSGCCKPPTGCDINETYWTPNPGVPVISDPDCSTWTNDQQTLCFDCGSCKAGVLAGIKKTWRIAGVLLILWLFILVIAYVTGCTAFRNANIRTRRSARCR
ncbi:unnamed protein product [Urochloa decumbens]|uniref:Tetraspanin-3 n=1 Tax=Urochloa decumbens TaxID=240449 RepID=A0ABC8X5X9_9POAL